MRNRILAIAAIAGALGAPIAAQAQSDTVGIARGGSTVIVNDDEGIAADASAAVSATIEKERMPSIFRCASPCGLHCMGLRQMPPEAHQNPPRRLQPPNEAADTKSDLEALQDGCERFHKVRLRAAKNAERGLTHHAFFVGTIPHSGQRSAVARRS